MSIADLFTTYWKQLTGLAGTVATGVWWLLRLERRQLMLQELMKQRDDQTRRLEADLENLAMDQKAYCSKVHDKIENDILAVIEDTKKVQERLHQRITENNENLLIKIGSVAEATARIEGHVQAIRNGN